MTGEDRLGLALSVLVHVGVAVAGVLGLPALTRPPPAPPEVIPVEFVTIAEETRTTEPPPEPAPKPEPEPQLAEAPPPEIPAPEPEAVPLPGEKPAPPEPDPEPEAEADPAPRLEVTPRVKPRPPTRFDPSRLAALIDRSIEESAPAAQAEAEAEKAPEEDEPKQPRTAAVDRFAAVTLKALIRDRVQKCWYLPAGAKDVADMQVTIRIDLRRNGRLARAPRFVDTGKHSLEGDEFYRIFAESARRAVQNCEPYEDLPPGQYHIWRSIEFTFDAGRMLGGG